jgi:hypothetical protein
MRSPTLGFFSASAGYFGVVADADDIIAGAKSEHGVRHARHKADHAMRMVRHHHLAPQSHRSPCGSRCSESPASQARREHRIFVSRFQRASLRPQRPRGATTPQAAARNGSCRFRTPPSTSVTELGASPASSAPCPGIKNAMEQSGNKNLGSARADLESRSARMLFSSPSEAESSLIGLWQVS